MSQHLSDLALHHRVPGQMARSGQRPFQGQHCPPTQSHQQRMHPMRRRSVLEPTTPFATGLACSPASLFVGQDGYAPHWHRHAYLYRDRLRHLPMRFQPYLESSNRIWQFQPSPHQHHIGFCQPVQDLAKSALLLGLQGQCNVCVAPYHDAVI